MSEIIIVGGGAAGMMAAINAAQNNVKVTILEKNEKLGKKIYITGKGRCNFTNASTGQEFLDNVIRNPKFLFSSQKYLDSQKLIELFEKWGLKTKIERGGRAFPESDKASDITKTITSMLSKLNVNIVYNCKVNGIKKQEEFELDTSKGVFFAKSVVVATGGVSYPLTGSSGDGYKIAKSFGHNIVELKPALVPILLKSDTKDLQGVALKNVNVCVLCEGKVVASQFGEMLFTHNGVSGPIILSLSSQINRCVGNLKLSIDLKPALSVQQLDNRILRDFDKYINKQLKNSLPELLLSSLVDVLIKYSDLDENKAVNQITQAERTRLVLAIKNWNFDIKELDDISLGVVTSGGVDTLQLNPNSMQSKIVSGLFFAGEVIDVDAFTGGYNLQIAFSTGYLAGAAAAKYIEK